MNFGPLNTELTWLICIHLNSTFSEGHISVHKGCCPFKFSTHCRQWHKLANPHLSGEWRRGSPTIFNYENSKIGLKFTVLAVRTLGQGEYPDKTFLRDVPLGRHENGYNFWGASPPKMLKGKKRPKLGAISGNFRFDCEYLRDGYSYRQAEKGVINNN